MIPESLFAIGSGIGPAIADHLWQSTLFAIAAALLTIALRRNRARIRYGLWLAASLKFLIPFSLLISLGSYLARPGAIVTAQGGLYSVVEEAGQPFTQAAAPAVAPIIYAANSAHLFSLLPEALAAVWLCGFFAVFGLWWLRWRRVASAVRGSAPMSQGREVDALRRLERIGSVRKPIPFLLSQEGLEPGIFGILRPVLLWPKGISEHLDDAHLDAILAHEISHVRRRDNFAAAIHMVVEAVFWFHPLVWWLGVRLVEERERACDEEVLRMGSEPQIYAESILKACEFCVGSPLSCVSGVTGADLKNRIVRIMTQQVSQKLDFRRKLLLGIAGILAIAVPLMYGRQQTQEKPAEPQAADIANIPNLKFEVASIRQDKSGDGQHIGMRIMDPANDGRLYATNVNLKTLLREAYGIQDSQIEGGPSWLNSERFDIEATSDSSVNDQLRKLSPDQARLVKHRMLQALLADRFQLTLRRETKELPVYALMVTKSDPKLQKSKDDGGTQGTDSPARHLTHIQLGGGQITFQGASMKSLAQFLSQQVGRMVLDKTGLTGNYDFALQWTPDDTRGPAGGGPGNGPPELQPASASSDSSGPSIFTALQEQLDLKLEPKRGPVEILAIDHVEQPSAN